RAEARDVESGGGSVAVANAEIDVLAREVDMMRGRTDPEIDLGVNLGEAAQSMHEPLRCKIRRGGDSKRAAALALQQPLGSVAYAVESIAHDNEVGTARLGDHQPLPFAVEKPQSELGLERLDLVTDGALGDKELRGCARKTLVAGRGLEGLGGHLRGLPARPWPRAWPKMRQ